MRAVRLIPALLAAPMLAWGGEAAPLPPTSAEAQLRARDERRPEQPITLDVAGHPVQVGGSWEYTHEWRDNFDLDEQRARNRRVQEHEVQLEARSRFGDRTEVFLQLVGLHDTRRTQGTPGKQVNRSLERGPMWLQRERLGGTPWLLQFGRVTLLDRRAWWWDEDLDGVRVRYLGKKWRLDTGIAHEAARKSSDERGVAPDMRGVTRWFGQASWLWARRHSVEAFWLLQRDRSAQPQPGAVFADEDSIDERDLDARWVGARASGEWRNKGVLHRLNYWGDLAWFAGRERVSAFEERAADGRFVALGTRSQRLRGHALDLGASASFDLPLRPLLTLGYARGSEQFRQTGLQENKMRFAGVKRWQRYGELLQPELSNLQVITAGTGVRFGRNSSLELLLHDYRQVRPSTVVEGSRLSADPGGTSRSLGREVDLLLAIRESRRVEFTAKASYFRPGAAFGPARRDPARSIELGMTVNF
ncbi:alginate export family protein [Ramlibacter alkalitolerans]|uniref:Alginate export family protein n=1 Tax=Ramlibacter alkalitolerans TaxID=2039631 RepID=A0ABS1JHC4_9BURK|nr:alginate export family protein [Ramlibacter alkalitolerans]MBL0423486.1 alginate export family protein [Ramlibacter alkalitolerans]